jgi:hypothetical protein
MLFRLHSRAFQSQCNHISEKGEEMSTEQHHCPQQKVRIKIGEIREEIQTSTTPWKKTSPRS